MRLRSQTGVLNGLQPVLRFEARVHERARCSTKCWLQTDLGARARTHQRLIMSTSCPLILDLNIHGPGRHRLPYLYWRPGNNGYLCFQVATPSISVFLNCSSFLESLGRGIFPLDLTELGSLPTGAKRACCCAGSGVQGTSLVCQRRSVQGNR